jgi:hypothetical protein
MDYDEITQSTGNKMEYPTQAEMDESEPQSDEEIRRQLGWHFYHENADIIEHDD